MLFTFKITVFDCQMSNGSAYTKQTSKVIRIIRTNDSINSMSITIKITTKFQTDIFPNRNPLLKFGLISI